jgi:hypothetical protein
MVLTDGFGSISRRFQYGFKMFYRFIFRIFANFAKYINTYGLKWFLPLPDCSRLMVSVQYPGY